MNERIRELAEQAGVSFLMEDDHSMVMNAVDLEKFAELIVRECCQFENSYSGDARLVSRHYGRRIREHFGVEE